MWGKAPPPSKRGTPITSRRSRKNMEGWVTTMGGYANFSVQIIDQVEEGDKKALADKEVFWQNQLRCYVQNGGHAHCWRKEK